MEEIKKRGGGGGRREKGEWKIRKRVRARRRQRKHQEMSPLSCVQGRRRSVLGLTSIIVTGVLWLSNEKQSGNVSAIQPYGRQTPRQEEAVEPLKGRKAVKLNPALVVLRVASLFPSDNLAQVSGRRWGAQGEIFALPLSHAGRGGEVRGMGRGRKRMGKGGRGMGGGSKRMGKGGRRR